MADLSERKDKQLQDVASRIRKVYETHAMRKYFMHADPAKKAVLCMFISMGIPMEVPMPFWKKQYLGMAKFMGFMLRTYTERKEMKTPVLPTVVPAGHNREEFGIFATRVLRAGMELLMFFKNTNVQRFTIGDDPNNKFWYAWVSIMGSMRVSNKGSIMVSIMTSMRVSIIVSILVSMCRVAGFACVFLMFLLVVTGP